MGFNSRFFTKQQIEQELSSEAEAEAAPIFGISLIESSRKDSISSGQGFDSDAGHGALNGVLSHESRISIADSGAVDMPDTARTLELLMDRALTASEGERHVAAKTPGNLLAKIATPTPVPQATSPRVSISAVEEEEETRRPTSAAME